MKYIRWDIAEMCRSYPQCLRVVGIALVVAWVGCSDDNGADTQSTESDTANNTDMDTGTSDTDGDTDTDSDTGENETPPELPSLCTLVVGQSPASEEDDWVSDDDGNARYPDIAFNGNTMLVWGYFSAEDDAAWEIQTAPYDPEPDGGLPGIDGGQPGPVVEPAVKGPIAQFPAMVPQGEAFGIAWLDGRWDPSPACQEDSNDCDPEIAFMRVDTAGQPIDSPVPVQVTYDAVVSSRPGIAATDSGYIVVWIEREETKASLIGVPLDPLGNPGMPQQISSDEGVDINTPAAVAARGDVVVVTWLPPNQRSVILRTLNGNAEPVGAPIVIDEGDQCSAPQVAAGSSDFMVSWSKQAYLDFEVYTRRLSGSGVPFDAVNRVSWTTSNVYDPSLAWNGTSYAIAWLSPHANGDQECAVSSCDQQVFASILDAEGAITSVPVQISEDPNPANHLAFSWDGSGWTALWELPRNYRYQIFYGRMVCE
ncbi:MAG: hypothetical protein QNJ97_08155 [Myxococcota bacterium]|nr:hypothetical protein [Myxococcota bacterium]